uniref:Large ribosomal subunit protein bL20c n=1 Tax=Sciadopitys verticillata TaxID=28979 RepID=G3XHI8_SCIVE|nr:ribosomal protein L20 [Sciadopitys verticillata]AMO00754.1 ribosomal protein L20 [Sciadopitys verticillata]BAK86735.1 ribosomal protein L20 [Sciadopitys verticillata]BAW34615.1 ribosomal protein L20 [Sciadopitys verticillata]BCK60785.1 ribosomal protein L20 [Sciadopitys verticillata]
MTRVKRGFIARKRRKKILAFASGSRGAQSKLFRTANQNTIRALVSADRDKNKRKRIFRRLWITRINAVCRANGVSYNNFMQNFYATRLILNRKTLSQIAVLDSNCFSTILKNIISLRMMK